MKLPVITCCALLSAATAFGQSTSAAQPPATGASSQTAPQTMTLSGCVGGGSNAQPFTLNNPIVVPGNPTAAAAGAATAPGQPATTPPPTSAAVPPPPAGSAMPPSSGATSSSPTSGSATPTSTPVPPTSGTATPTGTAGTATPPATAGTAGVAGTAGTAGAAGAAGAAGTATSGVTGMNGYRLSGTDMAAWSGQRVQIVGTMVPAATTNSSATGAAALPEFRVQSVQPIAGPCPQQ